MNGKKLLGCISLIFCVLCGSVSANSITECAVLSDVEHIKIAGHLDKKLEGVFVNLYIYGKDDNKLKYAGQTVSDADGDYEFDVDFKGRFSSGGKFVIKTKAQIEGTAVFIDAAGNDYKEAYLNSELQVIYQNIIDNITSSNLDTVLSDNKDKLCFDDVNLKSALSSGYAKQIASLVKFNAGNLSLDNIKNELKKAAIITNINHETSSNVKKLIFDNKELLGLDSNIIFNAVDEKIVDDFCKRISESEASINNADEFVGLIEDRAIISMAYYKKGKDGIKNILQTYPGKFNFTIYNSSDNDQDKVLQSILKAIENKQIKSIADIQRIMDIEIKKQASVTGPTGGGGGGGGIAISVTIPSKPQEQAETRVEQVIPKFYDLEEYSWAQESINNLAKRGILSGYAEGVFAPMNYLTRAQLCKILCSAFGMKITHSQTKFGDVSQDSWYGDYVSTLYMSGFISGISDNTFAPDQNIKRQDVCVMIYRMLLEDGLIKGETLSKKFEDEEDIDEYAAEAVRQLSSIGLISGDGEYFRPKDTIKRAEAAVLIDKLCEYRNKDLIN